MGLKKCEAGGQQSPLNMADHFVLMGHSNMGSTVKNNLHLANGKRASIHYSECQKQCRQTVLKVTDNFFSTEHTIRGEHSNKLFSFEMDFNDEKMDIPKAVSLTGDWQSRAVSLYQKGTEMKTVESVLNTSTVPEKDFSNLLKRLKSEVKSSSKENHPKIFPLIGCSPLNENRKQSCLESEKKKDIKLKELDNENLDNQKMKSKLSKDAKNMRVSTGVLSHGKLDKNNKNLSERNKQKQTVSCIKKDIQDSIKEEKQELKENKNMKMREEQNEKLSVQHTSSNDSHNYAIQKRIQNTTAEKSSTRKLMEHKMQNILISVPWQSNKMSYTRHDHIGN